MKTVVATLASTAVVLFASTATVNAGSPEIQAEMLSCLNNVCGIAPNGRDPTDWNNCRQNCVNRAAQAHGASAGNTYNCVAQCHALGDNNKATECHCNCLRASFPVHDSKYYSCDRPQVQVFENYTPKISYDDIVKIYNPWDKNFKVTYTVPCEETKKTQSTYQPPSTTYEQPAKKVTTYQEPAKNDYLQEGAKSGAAKVAASALGVVLAAAGFFL